MKGFVFTVDALFAVVVGISLAMSLFLLLEKAEPVQASNHAERDILAALDKSGGFEGVSESSLSFMLSPYNRCGTLALESGGVIAKEVSTCRCGNDGDIYSATRTFVKSNQAGAEYYVAALKTCLKG